MFILLAFLGILLCHPARCAERKANHSVAVIREGLDKVIKERHTAAMDSYMRLRNAQRTASRKNDMLILAQDIAKCFPNSEGHKRTAQRIADEHQGAVDAVELAMNDYTLRYSVYKHSKSLDIPAVQRVDNVKPDSGRQRNIPIAKTVTPGLPAASCGAGAGAGACKVSIDG